MNPSPRRRLRFPFGRALRAACALLPAALIAGCAGSGGSAEPAPAAPFTLRILHINDHHSRLGPDPGGELNIEGAPVQLSFGGFPALAAAIADASQGADNLLTLHAGDAITGDLYFTLFHGEADAELLNTVCFDAFAVGNHEFDAGDAGLARFLDYLWRDRSRCDTPALGANVRPTPGESALLPAGAPPYLQPSVVLERGGRRIGLIGIDIAGKTKASSSPDEGTLFEDEYVAAQREIDALRSEGVEHILLLTHIGYQNDLQLARRLSGVDAIIGGDSHTLLGEGFRAFGLTPGGEYPTRLRNADGDLVCVVQAWQYTWVLGRLELSFDEQGRVLECGGAPQLLVGDDLRRGDAHIDGAERENLLARIESEPLLRLARPQPAAQTVFERFQAQIAEFSAQVVGSVPERLCLRRAPGPFDRSRDGAPGCAEATDGHGGHAQQVVARAFLSLGQRYGGADIALQNGGGVRNGIASGPFTIGAAYLSLPFKNMLERLLMTGAEIHGVLEDAYDFFMENPGSNMGAWPYAAGLRWNVDLTRSREQGRVSELEVRGEDGRWRPLDPQQTYRVITNDYIAGGRDGFVGLAAITGERRQPTYLHYAQALADYAKDGGDLSRPKGDEMSTQSVVYPPASR